MILALLGTSECLHGTSNWENLCTGSASDTEFCFVDLRPKNFTINLVSSTVQGIGVYGQSVEGTHREPM